MAAFSVLYDHPALFKLDVSPGQVEELSDTGTAVRSQSVESFPPQVRAGIHQLAIFRYSEPVPPSDTWFGHSNVGKRPLNNPLPTDCSSEDSPADSYNLGTR